MESPSLCWGRLPLPLRHGGAAVVCGCCGVALFVAAVVLLFARTLCVSSLRRLWYVLYVTRHRPLK